MLGVLLFMGEEVYEETRVSWAMYHAVEVDVKDNQNTTSILRSKSSKALIFSIDDVVCTVHVHQECFFACRRAAASTLCVVTKSYQGCGCPTRSSHQAVTLTDDHESSRLSHCKTRNVPQSSFPWQPLTKRKEDTGTSSFKLQS